MKHLSLPRSSTPGGFPGLEAFSLPPPKHFNQTHNLQRYGFGHLLSEKLNLPFPLRPFSVSWQHGIYSNESFAQVKPYLTSKNHCATKDLIVVATQKDLTFLRSYGFGNVIVAGLPFCYVKPSLALRANVLLVFPGHSAEGEHERVDIPNDYLAYLAEFKKDFDAIIISQYALDWESEFYRQALVMGFKIIPGADPADENSLKRTRQILDSVTHVTTNCVGSHIFYALAAGCKVSICGPLNSYVIDSSMKVRLTHFSTDELLYAMAYGGRFTPAQVNRLFVTSPLDGIYDIPFGEEAIGSDFVIDDRRVLMAMLRWTLGGQVSGYLKGAVSRYLRGCTGMITAKCDDN